MLEGGLMRQSHTGVGDVRITTLTWSGCLGNLVPLWLISPISPWFKKRGFVPAPMSEWTLNISEQQLSVPEAAISQ